MYAKIVAFLQKLAGAEKAVVIGVAVTAAQALVGAFGYHLNGEAVGLITAIVAAGIGWFVSQHFAMKAKLAAAEAKSAKK